MRTHLVVIFVLAAFCVCLPASTVQESDRWDPPRLKSALTELGYEPKELNATKWEVKVTKGGFDVPVGAELSTSGNYIWLTARLGDKPTDERAGRLLRRNYKIQPTQFYVTEKGSLHIGLTCENRAMTNAILRKALEKITTDVADSAEDWNK